MSSIIPNPDNPIPGEEISSQKDKISDGCNCTVVLENFDTTERINARFVAVNERDARLQAQSMFGSNYSMKFYPDNGFVSQ